MSKDYVEVAPMHNAEPLPPAPIVQVSGPTEIHPGPVSQVPIADTLDTQ